jgi:methionine synthase II (cobalamin-independent)
VFATILGALPRPPDAATPEDAVHEVLARQEVLDLEPLTDGGLGRPDAATLVERLRSQEATGLVDAWQNATSVASRTVKAVVPGPYSLASGEPKAAVALAEALNEELRALAAAGAPMIEVEEPGAVRIGDDDAARTAFRDAQRRLTDGVTGTHLSLTIGGGNADAAGAATFLDAPYASYAFDLRAGPDNWRLIAEIPGDRGIICGALSPLAGSDDGPELLVWAAHYAASTGGRGLDRVGLANAPGLQHLDWPTVERKLVRLADAARLAARENTQELARVLDPRAISARSAAAGRFVPRPRRRSPGKPPPG